MIRGQSSPPAAWRGTGLHFSHIIYFYDVFVNTKIWANFDGSAKNRWDSHTAKGIDFVE